MIKKYKTTEWKETDRDDTDFYDDSWLDEPCDQMMYACDGMYFTPEEYREIFGCNPPTNRDFYFNDDNE